MEAVLQTLCKSKSKRSYRMTGITLKTGEGHTDFINFKKALIEEKAYPKTIPRHVTIHYGDDGTGNLYNIKNIETFVAKVGKAKAKKMVQKSLKDGRTILKQLNALKVPIYVVPGNWD